MENIKELSNEEKKEILIDNGWSCFKGFIANIEPTQGNIAVIDSDSMKDCLENGATEFFSHEDHDWFPFGLDTAFEHECNK